MNEATAGGRLTVTVDDYEQDFHAWAVENAVLLRQRRLAEIDVEHIAEELDDMGRSERNEIENHLINLLFQLLKWKYQPDHRSSSWRGSIREARRRIALRIKRMPSLKNWPDACLEDAYEIARSKDPENDALDPELFPPACSWTVAQVLDDGFFPES